MNTLEQKTNANLLSFVIAHKKIFFLLSLILILFSLPLINKGFGGDNDSWLVAMNTERMIEHKSYFFSRTTGFPIYEIINIPIIHNFGWIGSNTATLLISIMCLIVFLRILYKLTSIRHPVLLLVSLTIFPHFLVNSVSTMDYIWALTFDLAGFLAILNKKEKLGGILVGISGGFRVTGILFIVPYIFWQYIEKRPLKKIIGFTTITIISWLIAYSPVILKYGFSLLTPGRYSPALSSNALLHILYVIYRGSKLFGTLACMFLIFIFIYIFLKKRPILKEKLSILFFSVFFIHGLFFLIHSDEPAYLLPIVPFLFIFLERILPGKYLITFIILLFSYNFFDISRYSDEDADLRPLKAEQHSVIKNLKPSLTGGLYLKEIRRRKIIMALRNKLPRMNLGEKAIVINYEWADHYINVKNTNYIFPEKRGNTELEIENIKDYIGKSKYHDTYVFYKINFEDFKKILKFSNNIYYIEGSRRMIKILENFNIEDYSAKRITFENLIK